MSEENKMEEFVSYVENMTVLEQKVTLKSSLKESQMEELDQLAEAIAESLK